MALLVFQLPQFFVVWDCFAYCSSFTIPWLYSLNANSSPCTYSWGFPNGSVINICQQYKRHRRHGFDPRVWKIPWRRKWQLFLHGKYHRQRILAGYSLKGWKGLDATVWLSMCLFPNTPRVLALHEWKLSSLYFTSFAEYIIGVFTQYFSEIQTLCVKRSFLV